MKSQAQPTLHNRTISLTCALPRARGARLRGDRGSLGTVTLPAASGLEVTRASRPRGGPAGARPPHPGPLQRALGGTRGRHRGQSALGKPSGRKGGSTRQTPGCPRRTQTAPARRAPRTAPRPRTCPHFPASPRLARGGGRAPYPAPTPLTCRALGSLHGRPRGAVRRGPGRPRHLRGGAAPRRAHRPQPPLLRLPPTPGPAIPGHLSRR
ncbi:hypothetical protein R6Z07M_011748 [Ovis aries]